MNDVFGYEKTIAAAGSIISAQFAQLSIGSRVALVQNVQGEYGREIRTMLESGSSNIYFIDGNSQGSITVSAAVGGQGFLSAISGALAKCGSVDSLAVDLKAGNKCAASAAGGGITFAGGQIEKMSFTFATGLDAVTESFSIRVASMSKK